MSKKLVVAEKPSVARDIARVLGARQRGEGCLLGEGFVITWAIGHLVTLKEPEEIDPRYKQWRQGDLPILPETLPLKVLPKTKGQYAIVKKWMRDKEIASIVCATDAGREGELIFRNIYQMAGCQKPVERLWISSMTDEAIREGFAHLVPGHQYDALYHSARARSEADWLVGMNATRAFTLRYGPLLSVGRVQTPTLSLLVRRRQEIEAFVPQTYFTVEASFGDYKGLYCLPDKPVAAARLASEEEAKAVADAVRGKAGRIKEIQNEEKREAPPLLYDLTALQRQANSSLGFTAQRTLKTAQALYETHKLITYPRTDSRYLPKDMAATLEKTLRAMPEPYAAWAAPLLQKGLSLPRRVYDDSKVSDHHAILPSKKRPDLEKLSADEAKLYDLIARRLLAALSKPFVYDAQRVWTEVEQRLFYATGRVVQTLGWKEIERPPEKEEAPSLPPLQPGDTRKVERVQAKRKQTEPPKPYTDASLLAAMEHAGRQIEEESLREKMRGHGLGTPATRAAILERLVAVGYAQRKGKAWQATDKGVQLIEVVPEDIASAETTGRWEKALHDIAQGQGEEARFLSGIRRMAAHLVTFAFEDAPQTPFAQEERRGKRRKAASKTHDLSCPLCGEGRVTESAKAFGCSRWREGCSFTLWKDSLTRSGGPPLTWPVVSRVLAQGSVRGSTGMVIYQDGRLTFQKKETAAAFPTQQKQAESNHRRKP